MKSRRRVAGVLLLAVGGLAIWAMANAGARYGPAECEACQLGMPNPDSTTKIFLSTFAHKMSMSDFGYGRAPLTGDTVIVCTSSGCVDYTVTDTDQYEGTNYRPQNNNNPGNGGGGSGGSTSPGGGTGNNGGIGVGGGGGSGSGSGSGNVTVGPIKNEQPR